LYDFTVYTNSTGRCLPIVFCILNHLFQVENQSDDEGQDEDWSLMGAELERELGS
jgi:hypothetical protein